MGLKPMNCPAHVQLYAARAPLLPRPAGALRRAGPAAPQRAERARCTACCACATSRQDDAHIFCTEEQIQRRGHRAASSSASRSTTCSASSPSSSCRRGPTKRIGADEHVGPRRGRARSRRSTRAASTYEVNEGDGAFYGPKIDLHMTDSLGRSWQLGTVQLDYSMPERFDLAYTGADNAEHRPVMIHRALFGSFERFIGILIEHFAGEFPLWLAPVQAIVLPIADRHAEAAAGVLAALQRGPGCAPSSTTAPSRSGARSATPSCARSRTCSSSATARRRRAPSRSASAARATGSAPVAELVAPPGRAGWPERR